MKCSSRPPRRLTVLVALAGAAQLLIPRVQADAPLFSAVRGLAGVEYVRGSLREPLDNRDVSVRGWQLRVGFQMER